ncbi:hypothetical protein [Gemella massiliensis]|uniref:hypothetical protein n=1 Tax=Gemella massiliensis TaxID=1909670 RepID=UPI000930A86D|nr:hypothetical protein [Gemella massiliensis]
MYEAYAAIAQVLACVYALLMVSIWSDYLDFSWLFGKYSKILSLSLGTLLFLILLVLLATVR